MAARSLLVGLVVAWTVDDVAAVNCAYTTECTGGSVNNPNVECTGGTCTVEDCCYTKCNDAVITCDVPTKNNPDVFCTAATCVQGDADKLLCCQNSCSAYDTATTPCPEGKNKTDPETFTGADVGTEELCCIVVVGKCVIDNCKKNDDGDTMEAGQTVLSDAAINGKWCAAAVCLPSECCENAGQCDDAVCTAATTGSITATLVANRTNKYCARPDCVALTECCKQAISVTWDLGDYIMPVESAVAISFPEVANMQTGDKFSFDGDNDVYTITGIVARRLNDGSGRRLAPGTVTFTPPLTAATALVLSNNGAQTAIGVTVTPAASFPSAVSDPITFYKGHKTKFWLPNDKLTLLLETKDIKLYVSVLEGPSEDLQWFGRFFVFNSDGSKVCEIDVNRNEIRSPESFEQIVIKLGDSDAPLPAQIQTYGTTNGKVKFSISTMPWNTPGSSNFTQVQEVVYFETDDLVFMILPSHAGNEFPTSKALALKYMHLDFIVSEMRGEDQFGGILPEFWGLKARSEESRAMLTKPSRSRPLSGDDCGTCNGAPFWE